MPNICAMVKSRYIGDGHPTFNRNPYNGYINTYYWVDDHPLLYGNNGSLDPSTYVDMMFIYLHCFFYINVYRLYSMLSHIRHSLYRYGIFVYVQSIHVMYKHFFNALIPISLSLSLFFLTHSLKSSLIMSNNSLIQSQVL